MADIEAPPPPPREGPVDVPLMVSTSKQNPPPPAGPAVETTTTTTTYEQQQQLRTPQQQQQTQQQQSSSRQTNKNGEARYHMLIETQKMEWREQIALLTFLALVEWIQATVFCDEYYHACYLMQGWSISVGALSFLFTGIVWLLDICMPQVITKVFMVWASFALTLWWLAGMIALTFFWYYDTVELAAGYFATWGAFLLSLRMLLDHVTYMNTTQKRPINYRKKFSQWYLLIIIVVSVVEFCSAIYACCGDRGQTGSYVFSLGVVSAAFALAIFVPNGLDKLPPQALKGIGYFLLVWWITGTTVAIIAGPFILAGNGFFSSAVALLASYGLVRSVDLPENDDGDNSGGRYSSLRGNYRSGGGNTGAGGGSLDLN